MTKSASETPSESSPVPERGSESVEQGNKNVSRSDSGAVRGIPGFRPSPNIIEQKPFPVPELGEQGNRWANAWKEQEK